MLSEIKKAELENIKNFEKEIDKKKKSIVKSIDFLTELERRNVLAVYGDDIETAKKETKGFLSFRKSTSVNIPDGVKINGDLKLEILDEETGEIKDVTKDYITEKTEWKINKSELSKVLKSGASISAITNDKELKIELEEKQNISIPKIIL